MAVSLVLVSHSAQLAAGLAELAAQMAADVRIVPAGGLDDGGIGTSFDKVNTAIEKLRERGEEVLVLTDLGSATLTVESVLDFLDDDAVVFADAPFVEAAVASAVAAQGGKSLAECAQIAHEAANIFSVQQASQIGGVEEAETADMPSLQADSTENRTASAAGLTSTKADGYTRIVQVVDSVGLHARPAAKVAHMAANTDGHVLLNGEPAESLLSIMTLGIECGEEVTLTSDDPQYNAIVDEIADAIAAGLE